MVLAWGLGLFAAAVLIHLAAWRVFKPTHQYVTLLGLFAAILAIASIGLAVPAVSGAWRFPSTATDYLTFAMLYTALALAYVSTFSAVQADSPSMVLLLMVDGAAKRGVSRQELLEQLDDNVIIVPRIEDLVTGGLAVRHGPRYVIEQRGNLLAAVHMSYRALLKMEKGG